MKRSRLKRRRRRASPGSGKKGKSRLAWAHLNWQLGEVFVEKFVAKQTCNRIHQSASPPCPQNHRMAPGRVENPGWHPAVTGAHQEHACQGRARVRQVRALLPAPTQCPPPPPSPSPAHRSDWALNRFSSLKNAAHSAVPPVMHYPMRGRLLIWRQQTGSVDLLIPT